MGELGFEFQSLWLQYLFSFCYSIGCLGFLHLWDESRSRMTIWNGTQRLLTHFSICPHSFWAHLWPLLCLGGLSPMERTIWIPWLTGFHLGGAKGIPGRRLRVLLQCCLSGVVLPVRSSAVHLKLWLLLVAFSPWLQLPPGPRDVSSPWPFWATHFFVHSPNSPSSVSGPFIKVSLFEPSGVNPIFHWGLDCCKDQYWLAYV